MITLTIVRNPVDAGVDREIRKIDNINLVDLRRQMEEELGDVIIRVNTNIVTSDIPLKDGDFVDVRPVIGFGGDSKGSIWGTVAMVGLMVVSFGVGGLASGAGLFGAGMGAWSTWGFVAAAGTMLVGSSLINRHSFNSNSIDFGNYDVENDPTYNWGNPQTMEGQNNPIPITYGIVKSAGQTIGQYIENFNNKEYLNWLIACGEGEFTRIYDIKLNDNDVSSYSEIQVETRLGTNDQAIISNFNDTYFTKNVDYDISATGSDVFHPVYNYITDTVQGTGTQGIILRYKFPRGLYAINLKAEVTNLECWIDTYYRKVGTTNWIHWLDNVRIVGNQTSALDIQYRLDNLEPGEYEIRTAQTFTKTEPIHNRLPDPNNTQYNMHLVGITSIVYDDFVYPNIGLIGIRGMATSQLSGMPSLSFIKERKYVWVYIPFGDYGMYSQRPADNPAWAAYDMLHQCQRLKNIHTGEYEFVARGVPARDIMYEQFNEWAVWCDYHNKKVNIEITQTGKMINVINDNIACLGHGRITRFGTKYGVVWDRVQEPTQLFGMGNIIKDSFTEHYTQTSDRANCVEITYTDKNADYNRQTITVYGETYNTDAEEKMAQITYNGIVDYEQAYAEGKYQLYCNQYLVCSVGIDVSVDAIACVLGDVVLVAHDVPKWAYSGRIDKVDGLTLTLPIEVKDKTAQYAIVYRTREDVIINSSVTLISSENGYTVVTLTTTPSKMPEKHDVFALALVNYGIKPFVVKGISRTPDPLILHLDLQEYNESIYNEDYEIPEISYSPVGDKAKNVTELNANQVSYAGADGNRHSKMYVSWVGEDNGSKYVVQYSEDGITWKELVPTTSETSVSADVEPYKSYYVRVITKLGITQSSGVMTSLIPPGVDKLPPDVTELNVETLEDGTRRYYWSFEYPDTNDIAGFRIKYSQNVETTWYEAVEVQEGLITSQPYETKTVRQGMHIVMIKAVDNVGNESENFASCIVDFGDLLEENVLYKEEHSADGWSGVVFEEFENARIDSKGRIKGINAHPYWTSPETARWKSPENAHWKEEILPFSIKFSFNAIASGFWWLQYELRGSATFYYTLNDDNILKQYSTKIKVHAGDKIIISIKNSGTNGFTLSKLTSIIDVPDREEHFNDIEITTDGVELPIKTPNYYTTAVRIDSLPLYSGVPVYPQIVSRNPCIIKLVTSDGTSISAVAKVTWQGFEREVI